MVELARLSQQWHSLIKNFSWYCNKGWFYNQTCLAADAHYPDDISWVSSIGSRGNRECLKMFHHDGTLLEAYERNDATLLD